MNQKYDLIIIGAGPAGLTASIYTSRFGVSHLVIGSLSDGRMAEAIEVDNFPIEGKITGKELVEKMERRVKDFEGKIELDKVVKVTEQNGQFLIETMLGKEYFARALLLAIGVERKKLNVPGEEKFFGKGVSYCATCDGKFFAGKTVAVVGGSSAAATTADYLASLAKKVYLIHNENSLKADKVWQKRINENEKIEVILGNNIKELKGEDSLETAILEKEYEGNNELKIDGIFVEMGLSPNLEIISNLGVETDEQGFVKINKDGSTNVKGLFAAGDITNGSGNFRQIVTAMSQGAIAANSIHFYLKQN